MPRRNRAASGPAGLDPRPPLPRQGANIEVITGDRSRGTRAAPALETRQLEGVSRDCRPVRGAIGERYSSASIARARGQSQNAAYSPFVRVRGHFFVAKVAFRRAPLSPARQGRVGAPCRARGALQACAEGRGEAAWRDAR